MKTNFAVRSVAVACTALMANVGCGNLTVNVKKNPKAINASTTSSAPSQTSGGLNLLPYDQVKDHIDSIVNGLKGIAVDELIRILQKHDSDYVHQLRDGIRKYRAFVMKSANTPINDFGALDGFYTSADQCKKLGGAMSLEEANEAFGAVVGIAALALINEPSMPKMLSDQMRKDILALRDLVLQDLQISASGSPLKIDATDPNKTVATGNVVIKLQPLVDDSSETKLADADQELVLSFIRTLDKDQTGSIDALINVNYSKGGAKQSANGKLRLERTESANDYTYALQFDAWPNSSPASYARRMEFNKVAGNDHQLKITDILNPKSDDLAPKNAEKSVVTILDIKEGSQCKLGSEVPPTATATSTSTTTAAGTATVTTTSIATVTVTSVATVTVTATAIQTATGTGGEINNSLVNYGTIINNNTIINVDNGHGVAQNKGSSIFNSTGTCNDPVQKSCGAAITNKLTSP